MIPNSMQGDVAQEVNTRLAKATRELQEKYARGEGGKDVSVDGPSGAAYKEKYAKEQAERKKARDARKKAQEAAGEQTSSAAAQDSEEDEENDEEDLELRRIREQRIRQIKAAQNEKLENIAKGHGQLREITQDEFLAEMTGSKKVICHFYHRDFPRCEIMDHHLVKLAPRHIEAKFVKINAEKAPFFIDKLRVRTIPTVVLFIDGVAVDKIMGFEGLTDGQAPGKEDEWPTVRLARLLASKGILDSANIVDEDGAEREMLAKLADMRKAYVTRSFEDEDDDLDLSD